MDAGGPIQGGKALPFIRLALKETGRSGRAAGEKGQPNHGTAIQKKC